jgi:hypothetical protein
MSFAEEKGCAPGEHSISSEIEEIGRGKDPGTPYPYIGRSKERAMFAEGKIAHRVAKKVIIALLLPLALQVALGQSLGLRLGYAPSEGLAFGGSWTTSEIGDFRLRIVLDLAPKVTGAFVGYDLLVHYTSSEGEAYVGIGLGGLMAPFGTFGTTLTVGLALPGFRPTPFVEATYMYGFGESARLWRFILGLGGTLAGGP